MLDGEILERVSDWFQSKVVGTTYFYEVPSDDGKRIQARMSSSVKLTSEHLERPLEPKSWLTVHEVSSILIRGIDVREKDSALVTVGAILLKSKENNESAGERYQEGATYYLKVHGNGVDDLTEDLAP